MRTGLELNKLDVKLQVAGRHCFYSAKQAHQPENFQKKSCFTHLFYLSNQLLWLYGQYWDYEADGLND